MRDKRTIKAWTTAQSVIALPSGEPEYYGMVKGGTVRLGSKAGQSELGVEVGAKIKSHAIAATAIASRKGLGKVRHVEMRQLRLQDKVRRGEVKVMKVSADENLAYVLAKYSNREAVRKREQ